jgi:hypothetical protein
VIYSKDIKDIRACGLNSSNIYIFRAFRRTFYCYLRLYSKSSLTLNECMEIQSELLLSVIAVFEYDTNPPAIQKQQ